MKKLFFLLSTFIVLTICCLPLFADKASSDEAKEHYRLGNIYYEHGLYAQAQNEFQKALGATSGSSAKAPTNATMQKQDSAASMAMPAASGEYLVGVGDTLGITVWENSDLTQDVIVRPDGKISFPLVKEIDAENRTLMQINEDITNHLAEYIKTPNVTVALKQVAGNKVMVLGEVRSPGMYKLEQRKTVLEAIALAGGFTRDAVESSVVIVHGSLKDPKPQRLNLSKAMFGKTNDSMIIANQTIIYVPRKFIADVNYYITEILGPIAAGASTGSSVKGF